MQAKKSQKVFAIVVEFANGATKTVKVKGSSLEVAESRALKFHPTAKGVKRNGH
jgi:ribosome-binding protein aMBF1 (putative translation factor)